jgi:hypothetical protein
MTSATRIGQAMANWKYKIDISETYMKVQDEEAPIELLAKELADKLRACPYNGNETIVDIVDGLDSIYGNAQPDVDDFDELLEALYYFGDEGNRLWINTV